MRPGTETAAEALGVTEGTRHTLADAIVDALASTPDALARLRQLVEAPQPAPPAAYTVESLAATLRISSKSVRNAVARGELAAVKRAGRWIISGDAVVQWCRPDVRRRFLRDDARKCDKPLTEALARFDRQVSSIDVVQP